MKVLRWDTLDLDSLIPYISTIPTLFENDFTTTMLIAIIVQ